MGMRDLIKRVPVPMSGVMLGCAALGNLLQSYSESIRYVFGAISFLLFILLLLKAGLYPIAVKEDLKNPIMMSVSATFPMGTMLLSVYIKPIFYTVAFTIWILAIALHLLLILMFTYRFMRNVNMKNVYASYFIVYVGIAAAGITAPAYQMQFIGTAAFWFGFISLIALLLLVGYRHIRYSEIPEPAQALFCIFTAPGSLCLAAYLQSVDEKNLVLVSVLAVVSFALYVLVLAGLIPLLQLPFYPSYSAFTFPFVISAIASKQTAGFLMKNGIQASYLQPIIWIQTILAVLLVCYTLLRYGMFLLQIRVSPVKANAAN
ncbi:tellurite resistance protein TehA-like permease [Lacrimispora xylanisolvens]|uniref:Tellurite resistance protein TehA-like permease n=2 Tax=Lacrimispora xylanisolvens TaxID=384636 RepID=A0A2S6HTF6_9FIRM|nr:tellurite resistance protein TehA-like permease [Hungatella xylanolytica]